MKQSTPAVSALDGRPAGVISFVCLDNFRCGAYRISSFPVTATSVRVTSSARPVPAGGQMPRQRRETSEPSDRAAGRVPQKLASPYRSRRASACCPGREHGSGTRQAQRARCRAGRYGWLSTLQAHQRLTRSRLNLQGRARTARTVDISRPDASVVRRVVSRRPTDRRRTASTHPHPLIDTGPRPKSIRGWDALSLTPAPGQHKHPA